MDSHLMGVKLLLSYPPPLLFLPVLYLLYLLFILSILSSSPSSPPSPSSIFSVQDLLFRYQSTAYLYRPHHTEAFTSYHSPAMSSTGPARSNPSNAVDVDIPVPSIEIPSPTEPPATMTELAKKDAEQTLKAIENATEALFPLIDILAQVCHDLGSLAPQLTELGRALRRNADHITRRDTQMVDPKSTTHEPTSLADSIQSSAVESNDATASNNPATTNITADEIPISKKCNHSNTQLTSSKPGTVDSVQDDSSDSSAALISKRRRPNPSETSISHHSHERPKDIPYRDQAVANDGHSYPQNMAQNLTTNKTTQKAAGAQPSEHPPWGVPPFIPMPIPSIIDQPPMATDLRPVHKRPDYRRRQDMNAVPLAQSGKPENNKNMIGRHPVGQPARSTVILPKVGVRPRHFTDSQPGQGRTAGPSLGSHPIYRWSSDPVNVYMPTTWPSEWFTDMPTREGIRAALLQTGGGVYDSGRQDQIDDMVGAISQFLQGHHSQKPLTQARKISLL
ncbi:hypothetical protein P170DRAFT_426547 [Aspergillus steynii IBT 23096]|uniref:Uncharacterized protein n=1 Tax=Aspergillus steynii IBT 23096 TaxID=1392250 RepID=A0A2I2G9X1_9EURO|nr:uncharacterized protein P170DRAFT_426547 [Aspergillus steynii IBT 23096]PLB49674.1 hypothetical protein P170DRAFT_426547 [Aspergillus steynii IBT 23096]